MGIFSLFFSRGWAIDGQFEHHYEALVAWIFRVLMALILLVFDQKWSKTAENWPKSPFLTTFSTSGPQNVTPFHPEHFSPVSWPFRTDIPPFENMYWNWRPPQNGADWAQRVKYEPPHNFFYLAVLPFFCKKIWKIYRKLPI